MRAHVIPVGDTIRHDVDEDCVCGPDPRLHTTADGDAWIFVHHSLDGRGQHHHP